MTEEKIGKILGLTGSAVAFLYKIFKKSIDKKIAAQREWILIRVSSSYRQKKWEEAQKAQAEEDKRIAEALRLRKWNEINTIIQKLGNWFHYNRVTLSAYFNFTVRPTTFENYQDLRLTITHEFIDNAESIIHLFQNAPCADLANGIMKLDKSKLGWIAIPPDFKDEIIDIDAEENEEQRLNDMIDVQNMYHVEKSYRFKIGEHVTDGSLAISFTNKSSAREMPLEEIRHVRGVCRQIYKILQEKI